MGPVDLPEDLPSVDEKDLVRALGVALSQPEEPEGDRQGDGIEEVWTDRDHHIDEAILDQFASDLALAMPRVCRGVRHDEAGTAGLVKRRRKELDPDVVAVVGLRQVWEARVVLQLRLVDAIDVEWWIRHHEVESAQALVRIFVVAVALAYVTGEAMDS